MPSIPQIRTASGFAARLAWFYAALFVYAGIHLPFFPVWLKAKGLDAGTIGLVLAIPMLVRMFAIPLATREADRRDALRTGLISAALASTAAYALLGLADGAAAIMVIYALGSLAVTLLMPFADAFALKGLAQVGRAYGPVRLWGSATFILGSFGAGLLTDVMAPRHLIWIIVAAMGLTAIAALGLGSSNSEQQTSGERPTARALFRNPAFLAVLAAASLIQASHAMYYGFSTINWRAAGLDGTVIGALWALGIIAEIILFAFSARLPARIGPTELLLIGAAGGILRWSAMALDPPALALPLLQCLHAASFGATFLGSIGFISRAAPPGLTATGQGYLALAVGPTMAAATSLSGVLYAAYGNRAYAAMAVMSVAGGGCAFMAHRHAHA
jgi:MFS transporter, PPP family, 3-phenylpropionic acid transporter